jgi:predicted amidohydrolase YtcJ
MNFTAALLILLIASCSPGKKEADLILTHARVYTVDADFTVAEAIAIKDHRILAVGSAEEIAEEYASSQERDLEGKFVYPGWIDAHCHFFGYGMNLNAVDVSGTSSVEEIIALLKELSEAKHPASMDHGKGLGSERLGGAGISRQSACWMSTFPDTPILLRRIDGHAAWANSRALEIAGVTAQSRVDGGSVMLSGGEPSGILVDNAIGLVAFQHSGSH